MIQDHGLLVNWTADEDLVQLRRVPLAVSRPTMKVDYVAIGLLPSRKKRGVAFHATTRRLTRLPEARACRDSVR
jgi:hypothetical protein